MYSYSSSLDQPAVPRFPLELNSSPQVVVGIHDDGLAPTRTEAEGDDQESSLSATLRELKESLGASQNGRVCKLLAAGAIPKPSLEDVLPVTANDPGTFRKAMLAVSISLISSISRTSATLLDMDFSSPRAPLSMERATQRISIQSEPGSRVATPQEGQTPSHGAGQQSVVGLSQVHQPDERIVLTACSLRSIAKVATPSLLVC